jgi:3-hydroxy-9,10-secoandrosta-1,3,5(10)-triene-9,17-dione monooxygenase
MATVIRALPAAPKSICRMQQYWRDANTAARHAGLQPVVGYEVYGKSLLGIEDRISPAV